MQRFFGGCKSKDEEICLTSFTDCCGDLNEPVAIKGSGFGWKAVETLRKWTIGLLALGSTVIALVLYHKNKKLHRRLDLIREDWKCLKQERLRLKGELCRLQRSKSMNDDNIKNSSDMNKMLMDSLLREKSFTEQNEIERMRREIQKLKRELDQSYREKEMLSDQLQQIIRRSCTSSHQQ